MVVPDGRMLSWTGDDPAEHGMLTIPGHVITRLRLEHTTWRVRAHLDSTRRTHVHDVWHLLLIHAGCGSVLLPDGPLPIAAPCLLLVGPGEPHRFFVLPGEQLVYSEATFTGRTGLSVLRLPWSGLLSAWSGRHIRVPAHILLDADAANAFELAFRDLAADLAAELPDLPTLLQGHLSQLLFLVYRFLTGVPTTADHLEEARRFLASSAADAPSLADCARLAGCSARSFDRAFKSRYGMPPLRYRAVILAERAATLLRGSDLPLAEIATRCGFADVQYFNRWFARQWGQAPGRWRRAALANVRP